MKKMQPNRLTLHRETIQRLDGAIGGLIGGVAEPPSSQICCPDTLAVINAKPLGTK
jgi:hypothetical protein